MLSTSRSSAWATTPVLPFNRVGGVRRSACVIVDALQWKRRPGSSIWAFPRPSKTAIRCPGGFPALQWWSHRDEQEGDVRACFGLVDELAGGSGVSAVLDFDSDGSVGAGEA